MKDEVASEARRRHESHIGHPTHRPLSENYELVGLRGEEALSRSLGGAVDLVARPGGDDGHDKIVSLRDDDGSILRVRVDVKTARKAFNLLVEFGKVQRDVVYILARYDDAADRAFLLGWEYGAVVAAAPVKNFGYGVLNHYIPRAELRSIFELRRRVTSR